MNTVVVFFSLWVRCEDMLGRWILFAKSFQHENCDSNKMGPLIFMGLILWSLTFLISSRAHTNSFRRDRSASRRGHETGTLYSLTVETQILVLLMPVSTLERSDIVGAVLGHISVYEDLRNVKSGVTGKSVWRSMSQPR